MRSTVRINRKQKLDMQQFRKSRGKPHTVEYDVLEVYITARFIKHHHRALFQL